MQKDQCPTPDMLSDYLRGRLTVPDVATIAEHVARCARCRNEISRLSGTAEEAEPPTRPLDDAEKAELLGQLPEPPDGYVLLNQVARGGMGIIYRAYDLRLGRSVAIKVIRPSLAQTDAAVSRFLTEAYVTARLQHPGVPSVYEMGKMPDGRPYLAMRLIEGQTLASLLRAESGQSDGDDLSGRFLGVFEQVCQAVAFAHSQGVIHRDLKPSNVMVGQFGEVQVMDWGLAKVVRQEDDLPASVASASGSTVETAAAEQATISGTAVGTPEYMPPEQARGEVDAIDERSDVFGLGAILMHILTGRPPYTAADRHEVLRKARAADLDEAWQALEQCGASPELVALCRRCLAPDPAERPATATEVAEAVARIRADAERRAREAELARARAAVEAEQERKRRKLLAFSSLAIILVLLAGVAGTSWGWLAASRARRLAAERAVKEAAARRVAEQAQLLAEKRLDQLARSNDILLQVFDDLDLRQTRRSGEPLEATLGKRLARAARELKGEAVGDPVLVAQLQHRLAETLASLGHIADAETVLRQAVETLQSHDGPNSPRTRSARYSLAAVLRQRAAYDEACQILNDLLSTRTAGDPPLFASRVREELALCYRAMGKQEEARLMLEDVVAERKQKLGPDHIDTLRATRSLARAYRDLGRIEQATKLLEQVVPAFETELGPAHPETIDATNDLAGLYRQVGRLDEAIRLFEHCLQQVRARAGDDHPDTLALLNNLALAYGDRGDYGRAISLLSTAIEPNERRFGPDHPEVLAAKQNLASAYTQIGQPERAIPILEDVVPRKERALGASHPSTLRSINQLALAYSRAGKADEAQRLWESAYARAEHALGKDHPVTVLLMTNLAHRYLSLGRLRESGELLEPAVEWYRRQYGLRHPDTVRTLTLYGALLQQQRRFAEAEDVFRQALEGARALWGEDHLNTLQVRRNVAVTRFLQGAADEAIAMLEATLTAMEEAVGPDAAPTLDLMDNLAAAYRSANRIDDAIEMYRQLLERRTRTAGPNHPRTQLTAVLLASALRSRGQPQEAIKLLEPMLEAPLSPQVRTLAVRVLSAAYKDVGRDEDAQKLLQRRPQPAPSKKPTDQPSEEEQP